MKKVFCILAILYILVVGSITALADPFVKPDTEVPERVKPPVSTLLTFSK